MEEPQCGEVSEWSKEHAWKVCKSKGFEGSNPSLSATDSEKPGSASRVFRCVAGAQQPLMLWCIYYILVRHLLQALLSQVKYRGLLDCQTALVGQEGSAGTTESGRLTSRDARAGRLRWKKGSEDSARPRGRAFLFYFGVLIVAIIVDPGPVASAKKTLILRFQRVTRGELIGTWLAAGEHLQAL